MATSRVGAERPEVIRRRSYGERLGEQVNRLTAWLMDLDTRLGRETQARLEADGSLYATFKAFVERRAITSDPRRGVNIPGHPAGQRWRP